MYREKINASIDQVYQAGVATKILQYMNKIRNESDITQARRWVMELLQNARDLAWTGVPLRVQIELRENVLIFRHSGKPFRVRDILSIVNQVSSKNPGEGVGQFGTGFMTTYQLSERVEIHSILQEENCPGKEFRIELDRTGHSKEEILQAISGNLKELQAVDELPDARGHEPGTGYDTEFCYKLENERSRRIAETGVRDLADTILYVMLFSEGIGSVEITSYRGEESETILYRRGTVRERSAQLKELELIEERQGETHSHTFFFMQSQGMTLAAEYDSERGFLPVSERTPRIFKDFPLIGAERFPFPVVVNDLKFSPNEPRSGISLVDNPDSLEAENNKALMASAVARYQIFVRELLQIDTRGAANLVSLFEWQDNREWSREWVAENLYRAVWLIIEQLPMFPTVQGWLSLADERMHIIQSVSAEEKAGIGKLLAPLQGHLVPTDDTDWYQVLKPYEIPNGRIIHLEKLLQNATGYMDRYLREDDMSAMEWNLLLYETAMKNAAMETEIQAGNIAVFPSQGPKEQKAHRLFTIRQVYQDPGIPEILKDVAGALQMLDDPNGTEGGMSLRSMLLHQDFRLVSESSMPKYEITALTEYIREYSSRSHRVKQYQLYGKIYDEAWQKAWNLMLSCGPDDDMYELCNVWYKGILQKRDQIRDERFPAFLWRNTYSSILLDIQEKIETFSRLEELRRELSGWAEGERFFSWLNLFYSKCALYLREEDLYHRKIFPNQEGLLMSLAHLSRDDVQEEELKEIAACFQKKDASCNMYRELLDRSVSLKAWTVAAKNDRDAAMRISNVVQTLLMECSLSQAEMLYQEACTRLLGWIEEHRDRAQQYFPSFCREEDQMKLLTPKAAVGMHKKARDYAKLMESLGVGEPEELENLMLAAQQMLRKDDAVWDEEERYDVDADMWLEEDLFSLEEEERRRVCRAIGLAGEQYVFAWIRRELMSRGFLLLKEAADRVELTGGGTEYLLLYPDTEEYHQAGWDIAVTRRQRGEAGVLQEEKTWYIEVKTHTAGSVRRKQLRISNEQMRLAVECQDAYILLSVTYDFRKKEVLGVAVYENLCRHLARGSLVNAADCYWLREK